MKKLRQHGGFLKKLDNPGVFNFLNFGLSDMKSKTPDQLKDGDQCKVISGTHAGKSGTVRDINTSKSGHITITVEQKKRFDLRPWVKMLKFLQKAKPEVIVYRYQFRIN